MLLKLTNLGMTVLSAHFLDIFHIHVYRLLFPHILYLPVNLHNLQISVAYI